MYDYIVLDTSNTPDEAMVSQIQQADHIVILANATMPALKNAQITLSLVRELEAAVQEEQDLPQDRVTVVLNEYDTKNSRITVEQITNFLRQQVNVEILPDPSAISALNNGVPLITGDPRRVPAVAGLQALVQRVQQIVSSQTVEVRASSSEHDKGQSSNWTRRLFGG